MARIRLTKNELKAQRDALKRYQRYLPTLQLKKQQLQAELWSLESELHEKEAYLHELRTRLNAWIELFSEPFDFEGHLSIVQIDDQPDRIAGVEVVLLKEITFTVQIPDLLTTSPWVDDGIRMLQKVIRNQVEWQYLKAQYDQLFDEWTVTTQRVNLFEKVKIPDAQEHIRRIRIFLGDQQTAGVARAKLAKAKMATRGQRT